MEYQKVIFDLLPQDKERLRNAANGLNFPNNKAWLLSMIERSEQEIINRQEPIVKGEKGE